MRSGALPLAMGSLLSMAVASAARTNSELGSPISVEVDPGGPRPWVCACVAALGGTVVAIDVVKTELARVWALNGVVVRYPNAADPQGCAGALRVVVNLVDGQGTRHAVKALHASDAAVAVGVLHAGAGLARVYVFLDRARRLLDGPGHPGDGHEQVALSLLVARLAAHEIGHVLLRSPSHAREGLMRAKFDSRDGWQQQDAAYRLSPRDQAAVCRALGGTAVEQVALREPGWPP